MTNLKSRKFAATATDSALAGVQWEIIDGARRRSRPFCSMLSRRRFLQRSASVGATSALVLPNISCSAERPAVMEKPRHIIHMVADGMSLGTLTCADHLSRVLRQGRGLTWISLLNNPSVAGAWVNMRSLNSLVTDSAAAASSWGSGSRVINGSINQLPDGRDLTTLYELFADKGWKRGLVTTTEVTHATPAGFAANVNDRDTSARIALQYLHRKIDLLLGGGRKFFDPKVRKDKRDLWTAFEKAGYHRMETAGQLMTAPKQARWLGTFASSHLPFTVDHVNDPKLLETVPTLAQMTSAALGWLEGHPHFILQIEGGRVDQACHNCDITSALRDMIAFDEALDVVLAFQRRVADTLVVVTTDHGNGNPGLNGIGDAYGQSPFLFHHVLDVRESFPKILARLRTIETLLPPKDPKAGVHPADPKLKPDEADAHRPDEEDHPADDDDSAIGDDVMDDDAGDDNDSSRAGRRRRRRARQRVTVAPVEDIIEGIRAATGFRITPAKAEMLAEFLGRKGRAMYDQFNSEMAQLGQLMSNYTGLCFTGHSHTSDYVPLTAFGPGSELFRGFLENTDIFRFYTTLAGIDFRNPTEPLTTARAAPNRGEENVEEYLLG
jgi:alkaline phosphatase